MAQLAHCRSPNEALGDRLARARRALEGRQQLLALRYGVAPEPNALTTKKKKEGVVECFQGGGEWLGTC